MKPGLTCVVVMHDPWCPMAHGEGATCASGCRPVVRVVNEAEFTATVARDARNRAQRRADARRARRTGEAR